MTPSRLQPFCHLGVALDLRRNPSAKSGARPAKSLAPPEAAEPGSGAFRKQEPLFDAN